MRAVRGVWRWRRNPLRRSTDLTEAYAALITALLILFIAPTAGCLAGYHIRGALLESARAQGAQCHHVVATVVRIPVQPPVDPDPETSSRHDSRHRVVARWTGPNGAPRAGTVPARPDLSPGDRFRLWTDATGRPVARPMGTARATAQAVLAGVGAGIGTAGLLEGGRRVVGWRLLRRRYQQWDIAWERACQGWGRAGTGN